MADDDATSLTHVGAASGPSGPDAALRTPAISLHGVSKTYGAVRACAGVDLELHRGRIHGVLGENGAGKSTLMKIMIGLVAPDSGSIFIGGERTHLSDPTAAARHGIGMVHQHFSLVEPLRVWENVALGDSGKLRPADVRTRVGEISERYGLDIDPDAVVGDLPVGMRQRVEIIKCLRRDPSILIFDEPTSVLTPAESEQLFETLRQVVHDEGRAVALVSHKLDEILRATDEVTIMRQGVVVDEVVTARTTASALAAAMVGRNVSLRSERVALGVVDVSLDGTEVPDNEHETTPIVLELESVSVRTRDGRALLDDLNLHVRAGEIVGVAGVDGNGQRPLADVLSSLLAIDGGAVRVDGDVVAAGRAGAMARAGVGVIPEDRHDSGVVLDMSIAENLALVDLHESSRWGVIDVGALRGRAQHLIDDFEISCSGPDAPLSSLSGGNQQRVVLARELSREPTVLVAAQPTRGLDVGAIEYMTDRLRRVAESGVGVLLISSELEEILDLAHRIVVISDGRIIGEMDRNDADLDRIGLLMGGQAA
ncbi:MAG: ABC transporter ATP-binding protein [Ilumatobacter sp.]|uniref:ABC transporter ATP-binding protein n=1 Tax=Ilumatobacter sp. TaxID=1967498 RepID=UPI00391C424D